MSIWELHSILIVNGVQDSKSDIVGGYSLKKPTDFDFIKIMTKFGKNSTVYQKGRAIWGEVKDGSSINNYQIISFKNFDQ